MKSEVKAMPMTLRTVLPCAVALALAFTSLRASAQQPVIPQPAPLTTTNGSGAIASSNTFQSIFSAVTRSVNQNALRRSCLVVNTGTATMYVFFGAIANATTPTSVPLGAPSAAGGQGGALVCGSANGTEQEQISITGTSGDRFFAVQE